MEIRSIGGGAFTIHHNVVLAACAKAAHIDKEVRHAKLSEGK
jgi:hypothetical protein